MADSPSAGSTGSTAVAAFPPLDVVLVGAGARAQAWLAPLQRSGRLRLTATVARAAQAIAADVPRYASIDDALRAHPAAAFAVALPPRAALEAALQLADAGRTAVVEAPLHDAVADVRPEPTADCVRVAHGWVTLPTLRSVQRVVQRTRGGRLLVEVAGLPEADGGDVVEVLLHAAALVRALLPDATPSTVRQIDSGMMELDLAASLGGAAWSVQLRLATHGRRLTVQVADATHPARWSWEDDSETLMLGGKLAVALHATPPAAVRALAQLLPGTRGDGLTETAAAWRFVRSGLALLPSRTPLGGRAFRQSASIARRRPSALLERLGLRGELPQAGPPPGTLAAVLPPEPFEVWAFRAGIKPVAFLTVRPDEVARTLAFFGEIPFERRDRSVDIAEQDRWIDRRDQGEQRVELYIARDAELARRAARLQAELDPTRAVRELGALLGYPSCCVEAFARQDDRANNSRNRYDTHAHTLAPDGSTATPWPWELNNLHTVIAPFYPCSYRCERALRWVRVVLEELRRAHPALVDALRSTLAQPVLYFDHDHQLVLDGDADGSAVTYRSVALTAWSSGGLSALGHAVGLGNRLVLDDRCLLIERDGHAVVRLERTDPGLGLVAPFGCRQ